MSAAERIHATCVALGGHGVLLAGPTGAGKSDLALRLIDRGAVLVSDDYTWLTPDGDGLTASPPETIAGRIEVRGIGIVARAHRASAPVRLLVRLGDAPERMPEPRHRRLAGIDVPEIALSGFEASAPIKVEIALARLVEAPR